MGWFTNEIPSINDPEVILGLPEDMDDWGCDEWKLYYNRIKRDYNRQVAYDTWVIDTGRVHAFATGNWCRYNCDFVKWAIKEGLGDTLGSNFISKIYCGLENVSSGVESATRTVKHIAPLLVVGGVAVGTWYLLKMLRQ